MGVGGLAVAMSAGLMMLPTASARFWSRRVAWMLAIAMALTIAAALIGLMLLLAFLATGQSGDGAECRAVFFLSILAGPCGGILRRH